MGQNRSEEMVHHLQGSHCSGGLRNTRRDEPGAVLSIRYSLKSLSTHYLIAYDMNYIAIYRNNEVSHQNECTQISIINK